MIYSNNPRDSKFQSLNKKLRANLRKLKHTWMTQGKNENGTSTGNIWKSEYHVYAEKKNNTENLYKLLVFDLKSGKKLID